MLDVKIIRENPAYVKALCEVRGSSVDVDEFLLIDKEWLGMGTKIQELRSQLNVLSKERKVEEASVVKAEIQEREKSLAVVADKRKKMLDLFPNVLASGTPAGHSDQDNLEIFKWGTVPTFDFAPKSHDTLGKDLAILDLERGAKLSGSGFYYLVGDGARLQRAMFQYAEDLLVDRGFLATRTPYVTKKEALFGTGYLPFAQDEIYKIENSDLSLIGTSEQSIVPFYMDETIDLSKGALLYTGFSACFRYEAGAAGRATKGAFRVHQFHKQEQIVFCKQEESEYWHLACQQNVEDIMRGLEIPYRVVLVCIGDMGAPGYKKYDTEGWFAGFGEYRETQSNTNLTEYQARRTNIKYKDGDKKLFAHTISSTAITDRALLAIMENNQTKEGYIKIPEVLQSYMGGQDVIVPVQAKEKHIELDNGLKERARAFQFETVSDAFPILKEYSLKND